MSFCWHCGGDAGEPNHAARCDGRQGRVEARAAAEPVRPFEADLDDMAPIRDPGADDPRAGTIAERAARFHRLNPGVYRFAVSVCRYMVRRGCPHYGIGAVWEIMRFKYLETRGDIYKLNNNYRAWYARRIMATEPDLAGFFSVRECPNDQDYFTREARGA